jgi:excisionase family DNA binding protein
MADHDLLTLSEVAEYLRLSERTIRTLLERGEIPSVKIGRSYRVRRIDLEKLVTPPEAEKQSN